MRHRSKHTLFGRQNTINHNNSYSPTQKDNTRTSSTFTLGKNSQLTKNNNKLHSKSTYFYRWGSRLNYVVPSVCGLALLVGGVIAFNPSINNVEKVNAWSSTSSDGSLTFVIQDTDLNQGATSAKPGGVVYRYYPFTVSGTASKYAITLSAANGYTGELKGKNHPDAVIGKVAPGTVPDNFANNTWGYAMTERNAQTTDGADLTYNPVPASNSEAPALLTYRSGMTGEYTDNYKLAFAAKLGPDNPSDNYQTQVFVSVVADSAEIAKLGLADKNSNIITKMQDMTSAFCNNVDVGTEGRLQDTRDGKYYYVAKMADNRCWMAQNMDYDGGGAKTQDIAMWDNGSGEGHVTHTTAAYYDAGEYVYNGSNNNHAQTTACTENTVGLSNCTGSNQFSKVMPSSDLHYHVGNYYSWVAANAGVCPNGWQLPTSNTTSSGSFAGLLTPYKMASSATSGTIESTEEVSINGAAAKKYQIYNSPFYFVYGGSLYSGQLSYAGNRGLYWSSTPYSSSNGAYNLYFYSGVYPSNTTSGRSNGIPVRCVAK